MAEQVATLPRRPLLTYPEAAAVLAIGQRSLFTLVKEGKVKAVRIGAAVRFAPEELERFIREGGAS